jgi:hypothetical protein
MFASPYIHTKLLALIFLISITTTHAAVLLSNSCVGAGLPSCPGTLDLFNGDSIVLAAVNSPLLAPSSGGFLVQMVSAVYRDTNRNNELDFYYQFFNSVSCPANNVGQVCGTIMSESNFNFAGFTADVGYRTDVFTTGWSGGADPPHAAHRDAGSTIAFDFFLSPGDSTNVFVIKTNATAFTTGVVSVTDGDSSATVSSFQPAAAAGVPEPGGLLLASGGLILLAVVRWKRGTPAARASHCV